MLHRYKYQAGDFLYVPGHEPTGEDYEAPMVFDDNGHLIPPPPPPEPIRFGYLQIVDPTENEGIFGRYSGGMYRLQCTACNSEPFEMHIRAITQGLKRQSNSVFSCGCRRQQRKPIRRPRPPAPHQGKVFGRFIVSLWVDGKGWQCLCGECGQSFFVRTSAGLGAEGLRDCKDPCGE